MSLDEAARAYDRAAGEAMFRPSDASIVGAGVRAIGARGGSGPSERPAWGPRATLGVGGAIGSAGAWDGLATATVLDDAVLGTTNLARTEAGIELAARPSIFVTRLAVREATTAADAGTLAALDALGSARFEVSAPFARAFEGGEPSPLVHVIEPRLGAAIIAARTSGAYWSATGRPVALASGETAMASAGFRTAWGRLLGHSGGSLEADVGGVATVDPRETVDPGLVARGRTAWSSRFLGWGAEAASLLQNPRGRLFIGKARLGEEDAWHVTMKAAARAGLEPLIARTLASPSAREPSGGWLAAEGWSGGAEIGARLTRSIGATLSAQEDFTNRTLLEAHGSIGYAHPCRCISVDGFAGKRLGREGIDVWVSIDLAPR
jgi:hypothetical protein